MGWTLGSELSPELQAEVKAVFVNRHTGDNVPPWASGATCSLWRFVSDAAWLASTEFYITRKGSLALRRSCRSRWLNPATDQPSACLELVRY